MLLGADEPDTVSGLLPLKPDRRVALQQLVKLPRFAPILDHIRTYPEQWQTFLDAKAAEEHVPDVFASAGMCPTR